MNKVLIGGYYGYGNIGDEAILQAFNEQLKKHLPQVELRVLSANRQYTYNTHGLYSYSRKNPISTVSAMLWSDIFISGGGGLIQDSTSWRSPFFYLCQMLTAQILARRIYFMGQGVGPLKGSFARFLLAELLNTTDTIVIRDIQSKTFIESILPVKKEVTLGADIAFLLESSSIERASDILYEENINDLPKPLMIAVLKGKESDKKKIQYVSQAINDCLDQVGGSVLLVPFFSSMDMKFNESVLKNINFPKALLRRSYKPSEILSVLSTADHVIAGRLHAVIFSIIAAVPFTTMVYDPKMNNLLSEIGLKNEVITPLFGSKSLEEALLNDIENATDIVSKTKKSLPTLRERAKLNISKLEEMIVIKNEST